MDKNKKTILFLLVAAVFAFFAARAITNYVQKQPETAGEMVYVVITREEILPHEQITNVELVLRPKEFIPNDAIKDIEQVQGVATRSLVAEGDILREAHITRVTENLVIQKLTIHGRKGMVAHPLIIQGYHTQLHEGDLINVMVQKETVDMYGRALITAEVLLERARVLYVEQREGCIVVFLLLTITQSEHLFSRDLGSPIKITYSIIE